MIRRVALLLVLVLLAAACRAATGATADSRLVAVDGAGDVVVLTPEGELVAAVTQFDGEETAFQPVWSGAGNLVFVEQAAAGGALIVTNVDGEPLRRVEFVTAPFYVFPRPGGDGSVDIVTLRNQPGGGLAAEVVHDDESITPLEGNFPFYFTWTPEGQVIAHSDRASLATVYPDQGPSAARPGSFGAPAAWESSVVYIRFGGSTSYLSVLTGEQSRDLATVSGPTQLVVGGNAVAVRSIGSEDVTGGVEILAQAVPPVPSDALAVVGLEDGSVEIVATDGIVAFFWDPTGRRLLFLVVEDGSELGWRVWEDGAVSEYTSFTPDPQWFARFVPFFDQYAQSMTLWSPEGDAFAFPGAIGGETGVWVQYLDQEVPVRVSSGSWVAWGPAG